MLQSVTKVYAYCVNQTEKMHGTVKQTENTHKASVDSTNCTITVKNVIKCLKMSIK